MVHLHRKYSDSVSQSDYNALDGVPEEQKQVHELGKYEVLEQSWVKSVECAKVIECD